jgi:uncharacterized membrane protein YfcA
MGETAFLCGAALLAGWVDAVAGGGGLIQVPALFAVFPAAPAALLLGTNKLSSCCGTAMAVARYRSLRFVAPRAWAVAVAAALLGSGAGAFVATRVPSALMRPVVIVLVLGVLVSLLWSRGMTGPASQAHRQSGAGAQALLGGGAGLYDGFFGPGTGSFLIYFLVRWGRLDFVRASAAAKVINLATNASALGIFVGLGYVNYAAGVPMALCNIGGAWLGAGMVGRFGPVLVRRVFVVAVVALWVKLLADWLLGA